MNISEFQLTSFQIRILSSFEMKDDIFFQKLCGADEKKLPNSRNSICKLNLSPQSSSTYDRNMRVAYLE